MERVTSARAAALKDSTKVATRLDASTSLLPQPAVTLTADGLAYALKHEVFAGTVVQQVSFLCEDLGWPFLFYRALHSPLVSPGFLG